MVNYQEVVDEGKKVKVWERGIVVEHEDKYYWVDTEKGTIVMEGDFI